MNAPRSETESDASNGQRGPERKAKHELLESIKTMLTLSAWLVAGWIAVIVLSVIVYALVHLSWHRT